MATTAQGYELPFGLRKAAVQSAGAVLANTFTDTGDLVTDNDHGLTDGMRVIFKTIVTTTGIAINTYYFVVGATTNTFQVALTSGGAAIALTTNGSGTYQALWEYELDWPQKITNNTQTQSVTYTGGDKQLQRDIALGLGFTFDTDCIPTTAHRNIFSITEVTSGLPDGFTSATPLLGDGTRSGVTVGFWIESDTIIYADDGDQSDGLDRLWFPLGTLSLVAPAGRSTGDKPGVMQYSFQCNMDPSSDILGMTLPSGTTGAPVIHMVKAV